MSTTTTNGDGTATPTATATAAATATTSTASNNNNGASSGSGRSSGFEVVVAAMQLHPDNKAVQEGACKVMHAFLLPAMYNSSDPNQAAIVANEATRQRFAGIHVICDWYLTGPYYHLTRAHLFFDWLIQITGVGAIEPLGMALQQHASSLVIACCGCEVGINIWQADTKIWQALSLINL